LMFRFLTDVPVKKSQTLRSTLSHAFCHLISSMDDISPQVSQRATVYLGTIHDKAIQTLLWCLEFQFDLVPGDRPPILKNLYQLFNILIERNILSWEFFANRFESIIYEIQETKQNKPEESETSNQNNNKEPTKDKPVSSRVRVRSGAESVRSLAESMKYPYKRTYSAPAGIALNTKQSAPNRYQEEEKNDYKRQQSAPVIRQKVSKTVSDTPAPGMTRLASQSGTFNEDIDYKEIAIKSMDLGSIDKETLHLMVFLFMQFLSHPHQAEIPENKSCVKYLALQKSFHGLFAILGYDEKEQRFRTMPHKIRTTAQFCSFFANLPQVMDNNFGIGNHLISNIVAILFKSPFPPRYVANWQPTYSILHENLIFQGLHYTLWHLEPIVRKQWLEACLVLVYKYNFSEPEQLSDKVVGLIRIIVNSISAQVHVCSKYCKPEGTGLTMRSHELSETSIGNIGTATLQGTEENTPFDSRMSPTSNKKFDNNDEMSSASDKGDANSELETIFENTKSLSHSPEKKMNKNNHENPLFFDLLPQAAPCMVSGWLPDDQSLTNEGLPTGWSMQLMDNGKVLYVDNINGSHTWKDPRTGCEGHSFKRRRGPFFSSPPSPLSLMDVLTVGATASMVDKTAQRENLIEEEIEQPPEERLLPIGTQDVRRQNKAKHQHMSLLDRVWQVLGSIEDEEDCVPLVGRDMSSKIKIASSMDDMLESTHIKSNGEIDKHEKDQINGDIKESLRTGNNLRQRKLGVSNGVSLKEEETLADGGAGDSHSSQSQSKDYKQFQQVTKQSYLRIGEDTVIDRCSSCGALTEKYTDSEVALALVVVNTFVHRDPQLAASLLPEIFIVVSRIASKPLYNWELEGSLTVIPGNPRSVARQFLRVTLQQLSSNGVFPLLFKIDLDENQRRQFYSTIVGCLNDFTDLSPTVPVQLFFENIDSIKQSMEQTLNSCLPNLICFLSFIQFDHIVNWSSVFAPLEMFFRNLSLLTLSQDGKTEKVDPNGKDIRLSNIEPVMKLAVYAMKMTGVNNHRSLLEPIAKVIGFAIQFCTFQFQDLVDICYYCNKAFVKERDKSCLIRAVIAKFIDALKYKTSIPDVNFLYLGSMMLQDAKGELPPSSILEDVPKIELGLAGPIHIGSTPWLEQYLPDIVEFVADVHTLGKVKSHVRGMTIGLNQDTLGGILKAALSQFLALEIARMSLDKNEMKITKYMPWLFNPPNTILSQGPKEFLECVSHIRLLSWLLLGAVNHTLLVGFKEGSPCQPIPLEASCHIADHIEVILAGFAEQSKTSVVHMCSLFHAFILSQLWTVYLEHIQPSGNTKEEQLLAPSILLDFWVKVTPGILQLVSHSKVLAEMVNLHFLSLMEALLECRSNILAKLMPLWCPVLHAYNTTLPDHIRVRLQSIHDSLPIKPMAAQDTAINTNLLNWLHRLQFKMGQIELQASNATQQFFTV